MVTIKPGTRVVRGPDWAAKGQDNGEGFLGTVIFVPKPGSGDNKVTVIWDSGRELRYRAGQDGKYDLRVFDTAPTGVVHSIIICDGCGEDGVRGMRWKCTTCDDFDLCSKCYMAGKHDITHTFVRIDTETSTAFAVPSRESTKDSRREAFGILPGAEVMRGPHWKWKNDDGGDGEIGYVKDLVTWEENGCRGAVTVKWKQTTDFGTYRVGGEGRVDVIYTSKKKTASGGYYYRDHLPLVDVVSPGEVILKRGDKAIVNLTLQAFRQLQDNEAYGGWNDAMKQCMEELGTIVNIALQGKTIVLQYEDGQEWAVNRASLTRKHTFTVGDAVRILDDINAVRDLQEGHGGWNDRMKSTLGKTGRIMKIDNDGDMTVKLDNKNWIFSPVCITPVDESMAENVPKLSDSERKVADSDFDDVGIFTTDKVAEAIAQLFVDMLRARPGEDTGMISIVQAAGDGNLAAVKEIVRKSPEKVNQKVEGKTALQISAFQGLEDVVQFLLENKADVNATDSDGDTALHYSAFGAESDTMAVLLKHKAKLDEVNKKQHTPLHVAVGKKAKECVALLVNAGASCTIVDKGGDTAMHDAINMASDDIIKLVLECRKADFSIVNKRGFNVLQWAVVKDSKVAVEIILARNKQVVEIQTTDGFTALHIACANGFVEIASALLNKGKCNVNARDRKKRTPLILAVSRNHKRTIEMLLKSPGKSKIRDCSVDLAYEFSGIDVNAQDENGNAALHVAQQSLSLSQMVRQGKSQPGISNEIISSLVEAKADIHLKNNEGLTPLDLAADDNAKEQMKKIAEKAKKNTFATTIKGNRLPVHWQLDQEKGLVVKRITLSKSDAMMKSEWDLVENKFYETLPQAEIISVQRVQNGPLWEMYSMKKMDFERRYGVGCSNELQLFHGTKTELVDVVCHQNFDPRLAGGRTGTLFGKGAYFATTAKYSDGYATRDPSTGNKVMFLAKCLVGKYTTGDPTYVRPPQIDPKDFKKGMYDSCVDNVGNPRIFCIFDQYQCYPDYIIEYL